MDRYEELLTEAGRMNLQRLNPGFGGRLTGNNCPGTASSLAHYLRTGEERPSRSLMPGQAFEQTDNGTFTRTSLHLVVAQLSGPRRHGQFRIVTGDAGERHHEFILLNIRGTVYYVDAQPRPPIVTRDITASFSWVQRFEVYSGPGYAVRIAR